LRDPAAPGMLGVAPAARSSWLPASTKSSPRSYV